MILYKALLDKVFLSKTKIENGTPFQRYITKAVEQTSKFTERLSKSREQKITSCSWLPFCSLLLLNLFSAFSMAFCEFWCLFDCFRTVPFNGVPFSIFLLIRDYCTPLSLDGFSNATTLLSLSFKVFFVKIIPPPLCLKTFWNFFWKQKENDSFNEKHHVNRIELSTFIFINFHKTYLCDALTKWVTKWC